MRPTGRECSGFGSLEQPPNRRQEDGGQSKLGSVAQDRLYLLLEDLAGGDAQALFGHVAEMAEMTPILLLDDIFDKLDQHRVEQIVKVVAGEQFGQIFLTDTNREHLDAIIHKMDADFRIFDVETGKVELVK